MRSTAMSWRDDDGFGNLLFPSTQGDEGDDIDLRAVFLGVLARGARRFVEAVESSAKAQFEALALSAANPMSAPAMAVAQSFPNNVTMPSRS
jgi:hypothetical protein